MSKRDRAIELRKHLIDMVQLAKKECREFNEDEQKTFDEEKNELLSIAEEIKATQDKLEEIEETIPTVADTPMGEPSNPTEGEDAPMDEEQANCNLPKDEEQPKEEKMNEEEPQDENQNENVENSEEINNEEEPKNEEEPQEEDNSQEPQDEEKIKKEQKRNITKMNNDFSILKAVRSVVNHTEMDATEAAVVAEGAKQMRAAGLNAVGKILIPGESRDGATVSNNVVTVNTAKDVDGNTIALGEHDDVVQTDFQSILEPLYAKSALAQAGVTFLRGLTNDIQIPVMDKQNVGWAGEIDAAARTTATFTNKKMSPKRITAFTDISKQMLAQDSLSVEAVIRRDIVNALNNQLEATVLGKVAGSDIKPAGIGYGKTVETVSDYAKLCTFEAGLENKNLFGDAKYIMSPNAKAAFRAMAQSAKTTRLVMEGGEIDGTPVIATTNVADKEFYYGLFNNVYVGQWGSVEIIVDELTQAVNGCIRLIINAYFDAIVVRPDAVLVGKTA